MQEESSNKDALVPVVIPGDITVERFSRVLVNILESDECNRTFCEDSAHLIYEDRNGNCYVHTSIGGSNANKMKETILHITKEARLQEALRGPALKKGVTELVHKVVSENTLFRMFCVAESVFHELHGKHYLVHCLRQQPSGSVMYGPLGDMTLEEFTGSRYDPECN